MNQANQTTLTKLLSQTEKRLLKAIIHSITETEKRLSKKIELNTKTLDKHTGIFEEHTGILDKHTKTLKNHTDTLEKHTKKFEEQGELIKKNSFDIRSNGVLMEEMNDKLDLAFEGLVNNQEAIKRIEEKIDNSHLEMIPSLMTTVTNHSVRIKKLESKVK